MDVVISINSSSSSILKHPKTQQRSRWQSAVSVSGRLIQTKFLGLDIPIKVAAKIKSGEVGRVYSQTCRNQ